MNNLTTILKQELNLIGIALTFFSRIPCPIQLDFSADKLSKASRYFALIGWLLGALVAVIFYLFSFIFSADISLWLAMAFSLLLTGCFHEDGLADMADGFGGGFSTEQKLNIMKDSRVGTYGASILIFALLGKFLLISELFELSQVKVFIYIPIAYALSRGVSASLIFDMQYQRQDLTSKAKPLANKQSKLDIVILAMSLMPLFWLLSTNQLGLLLVALFIVRYLLKAFFNKQISGYTGDCLGAAQQLSELLIYLLLIASLNV
ncbi:adenosylcobinamide-GDP ribazoletransferase [Catenovulum adriaticum]|uniref:Adenosylcobinamide-GDP ribazoletransferase n=1 Tax=Catenovulum adriaticum TaxID=2984846 RepID=A0ABY7AID0_9ALTE|nr:adenosylcobinamide-GDP ribazoletransferase [Catenovulum sp. TS8]WAJ68963.1 adenosylcobinamide-GDP ribazoletransferase [Catenovulum sp. TS8]